MPANLNPWRPAIFDHPLPRWAFPSRAPWSIIVAERNWHRIDKAPKGIGPLLLRAGPDLSDPTYVGYQADDGRWLAAGDNSAEFIRRTTARFRYSTAADDGATS